MNVNKYEKDGYSITEYLNNGVVTATIKEKISTHEPVPEPVPEPTPTIEEQILAENQYQTMLLELSAGGM